MATLQIFRETALPGTLVNDAIYFIANPATPNYVETYVVNGAGNVKRSPTTSDIAAQISSAITAAGGTVVVANIVARDALANTQGLQAYVIDATGDITVSSGAAMYIFDISLGWVKTAEFESMDLVLSWSAVTGKPTSTPAAIDAAVGNSHTHANKTQLDLIGQDAGGNLTYNGNLPVVAWSSTGW